MSWVRDYDLPDERAYSHRTCNNTFNIRCAHISYPSDDDDDDDDGDDRQDPKKERLLSGPPGPVLVCPLWGRRQAPRAVYFDKQFDIMGILIALAARSHTNNVQTRSVSTYNTYYNIMYNINSTCKRWLHTMNRPPTRGPQHRRRCAAAGAVQRTRVMLLHTAACCSYVYYTLLYTCRAC